MIFINKNNPVCLRITLSYTCIYYVNLVVPHITDAIQEWVEKVAQKPVSETGKVPEVCIIELGGIVGDIESMAFVEAFRQFQFRVKRENFCVAHVSLVPQVRLTLNCVFTYLNNFLFSQKPQENPKPNRHNPLSGNFAVWDYHRT